MDLDKKTEDKRKDSLGWIFWLGILLAIGGGILTSFKFWVGIASLAVSSAFIIAGVYGDLKKNVIQTIANRKNDPEVYAFFWKSIFSWNLVQQDIVESYRERRGIFYMGLFYFFVLEITYIAFIVFPIGQELMQGHFLKPFVGLVSICCLTVFALLGFRGYSVLVSSDKRKSIRGGRSFVIGLLGVGLLFSVIGAFVK